MCRKNHLLGCCGVCLGLGLLMGSGLDSGFLALCIGLGLIVLGLGFLRQK